MRMILSIALIAIFSCTPRPMDQNSETRRPITEVLSAHTAEWMKLPGVIGTGETKKDDQPAIMIFIDTLTDELRSKLPSQVDGYSVVIEQSGKIVPLR
jgi:hypothetical protein